GRAVRPERPRAVRGRCAAPGGHAAAVLVAASTRIARDRRKRCGGTYMLTATQFVATLCCALFTGAAIYVNLVEHPARMSCDTKIAATVWAPSYQRGAVMQASLAILSFMAGAPAWWVCGGLLWLVGGALIGVGGPLTSAVVTSARRQVPGP